MQGNVHASSRPVQGRQLDPSVVPQLLFFAAALVIYYITRFPVLYSDSLAAWPLTDQLRNPDLYSPNDLLMKAEVSGNFLLYRLLAFFPFFAGNFALRDFVLYIPIFLLWCLAWYFLYREISPSRTIAFVALVLLLFSDKKMGLNWSFAPNPNLVSYTSVQFAQVFAILLFLRDKRMVSLAIIAATGYLHPATALCYGSVLCTMLGLDAWQKRQWQPLVPALLLGLLSAPNIALIVSHDQGFSLNARVYWDHLYQLGYHVYLEDHFKNGYAFTCIVIALVMIAVGSGRLPVRHGKTLLLFMAVSLAGCALWLLNAYLFHSIPVLFTYFVTRTFYIIKPLLILLAVHLGLAAARSSRHWLSTFAGVLFVSTIFVSSPTVACIIAAAMAAFLVKERAGLAVFLGLSTIHLGQTICALGSAALLARFGAHASLIPSLHWLKESYYAQSFTLFEIFVMLVAVPFCIMLARRTRRCSAAVHGSSFFPLLALLLAAVVTSQSIRFAVYPEKYRKIFSPQKNYGLARVDPGYSALVDWAKGTGGRLFVVPPQDIPVFRSFRYLTKKGVFLQGFDLYQFTYSPVYLEEALRRLDLLGGRIEGRHRFDCRKYNEISLAAIQKTGADYIVFERNNFANVQKFTAKPAYENEGYVAYAVADLP